MRTKLAGLWASLMFIYLYVDLLGFYKPGVVEGILVGKVWEFDVSQAWALGALLMMTVPSLMVCLSLIMPKRLTRWTSIVVASLYVVISIGNTIGESWTAYFGFAATVEVVLLLLAIRYAWRWPKLEPKN